MPVKEPLDASLEGISEDFDEIDKKAKKAAKSLKEKQKEFTKVEEKAKKEITKRDTKFEKKIAKIAEKDRVKAVKNFGSNKKKSKFLQDLVGPKAANNIFKMGRNPVAFFTGIAKAIPFLGGVFAAFEIATFIVDELAKIDAFLKKFTDEAARRLDLVRSRAEQAGINAGLIQKIITTASGGSDPRAAYNTFQIFNENAAELEGNFALHNNSGVN